MKKIGLLLSLMLLLALAACGGAGVEQLPASGTTDDVEAPAEAVDNAGNGEVAPVTDDAAAVPDSDPRQVRDRDWTKGTDDPLITIIEYGDFQ